jgi:hypothetical protein
MRSNLCLWNDAKLFSQFVIYCLTLQGFFLQKKDFVSRARWHITVIPTLRRQKQEDLEFEASLTDITRHYLKTNKQQTKKSPKERLLTFILRFFFSFFFPQYWGLNSGPHAYYIGAIPFEHSTSPQLVSFLHCLQDLSVLT